MFVFFLCKPCMLRIYKFSKTSVGVDVCSGPPKPVVSSIARVRPAGHLALNACALRSDARAPHTASHARLRAGPHSGRNQFRRSCEPALLEEEWGCRGGHQRPGYADEDEERRRWSSESRCVRWRRRSRRRRRRGAPGRSPCPCPCLCTCP